jgi:soluble lytic murein transglycosylase-like protein
VLFTIVSFLFFSYVVLASAQVRWNPDNKEHIKDYIIYLASKEGVSVQKALAVAKCESNFNPNSLNHTSKEYSVGVFQINLKVHKDITEEEARNPFRNINWAMDKLIQGKWSMWTCSKML